MFDIPVADRADFTISADMPLGERPWQIGLIVGPSGSGKSTILNEMFAAPIVPEWPQGKAILDGFASQYTISEITGALSSVGFSSPPAWLRPYGVLSNGEQFRADLSRILLESTDGVAVVDEFTSVVDRTVAKIASAAVAKHVRRGSRQLVAASCHYDIVDWLTPDWVFDTLTGTFRWECLQRPSIEVEVYRTTPATWPTFHRHHYLSGELSRSAACFVALVDGRPAAFASAIHFPHPKVRNIWREHRTVCLPDFQGVGIGNALSEFVASCYTAEGRRYRSVTGSPAMIRHRARSPKWRMDRKPGRAPTIGRTSSIGVSTADDRYTASFEYVGPNSTAEQSAAMLLAAAPTASVVRNTRRAGQTFRVPGAPSARIR